LHFEFQTMLIDSHAHINFQEYENQLDDVIKRSLDNNTWIITVGSNFDLSQKAVEIANKYKLGIWAVIGCHPIDLSKNFEDKLVIAGEEKTYSYKKEVVDYDKYYDLAVKNPKVVAIGEVGLDFFRLADKEHSLEEIKKIQLESFRQFIKLAQELNLPLVLHCRGEESKPYEAYDLMLEVLSGELKKNGSADGSTKLTMTASPGVIHCFGGTLAQAKEFVDLGFYIGFTGIVTFKNAKDLQEIARQIPLVKILAETDAPFLAPEPYRGTKNEPTFVRYVVQKIADLKEMTFEEVAKQIYDNTCSLFKL
jgi:TatD DNase family protein